MRWVMVLGLSVAACSPNTDRTDAGSVVRDAAALRDFDSVALESSDQVEITQGPGFAVRIDGPAAARERLDIRREGNVLKIGRKRDPLWSGSGDAVKIRVTMPNLQAAVLAGTGDITIDRTGDDFSGTLGGTGDMTIGQLRGDKAALTVAGTGTIAAAGAVRHLTLSVAGSGDIDARQVEAGEATVSIAGTGDIAADIRGPAQVSLVGSGSATLGREARCVVNRVGTGTATCG